MGRYGTNYPYRASWTFYGVGGNLPEDAIYPFAAKDGDGNPLNGANKYVLHFTKAEVPPSERILVAHNVRYRKLSRATPYNRYALGDRSGIKFGNDGSLTLYIQNEMPGTDKETNWLPAPKDGEFRVALRPYGPKKEVADGTWSPPAIKRAE